MGNKEIYFRIIVVVLLTSFLSSLFISLNKEDKTRYKIIQGNNVYYTDSYSVNSNGCINFLHRKKTNILVCDKYTIIDNFGK